MSDHPPKAEEKVELADRIAKIYRQAFDAWMAALRLEDEQERKARPSTINTRKTSRELNRAFLLRLVDVVWQTANEDSSVPSTRWASQMIDRAKLEFEEVVDE